MNLHRIVINYKTIVMRETVEQKENTSFVIFEVTVT